MAMGGLELACRYVYMLVIAMIAFTLIFIFSPLIFFPLRRLVEVIKFATLVDFLTFRYRGGAVAKMTCVCLVVASMPLFLAQFFALRSIVEFNLSPQLQSPAMLALVVLIGLIVARAIRGDTASYLSRMMASAGLLLVLAMGATAVSKG